MKRVILVANEHRHHLQAAIGAAAAAVGSLAGRDAYEAVKKYLSGKGVPHQDRTMKTTDVPSNSTYWHA